MNATASGWLNWPPAAGTVAAQYVSSESSVALSRQVRSVFACSTEHAPTVPSACGCAAAAVAPVRSTWPLENR